MVNINGKLQLAFLRFEMKLNKFKKISELINLVPKPYAKYNNFISKSI